MCSIMLCIHPHATSPVPLTLSHPIPSHPIPPSPYPFYPSLSIPPSPSPLLSLPPLPVAGTEAVTNEVRSALTSATAHLEATLEPLIKSVPIDSALLDVKLAEMAEEVRECYIIYTYIINGYSVYTL